MSANEFISEDMRALVKALAREQAQMVSFSISELLADLQPAQRVRVAASDRATAYTAIFGDANRSERIIGQEMNRVRVTLLNTGTAGVIWVGFASNIGVRSNSFPLVVGASLTVATKAEMYALADTVGAQLSVISEEYDGK